MSLMRRRSLMIMEEEEMAKYRLINSFTISEATRNIVMDVDSEGNPFELEDFVLEVVGSCDQSSIGAAHVNVNSIAFLNALSIAKTGTDLLNYGSICYNQGMIIKADSANGSNGCIAQGNTIKTLVKQYLTEKVKKIEVSMANASSKFEAGTTLTLYGR